MTDFYYAVGDIHGCFDLLDQLMANIAQDAATHGIEDATLVFLGDYVDRGPRSDLVIDALANDRYFPQWKKVYLCGNHEEMIIEAGDGYAQTWLNNGGIETIFSYVTKNTPGTTMLLDFFKALPERHWEWLHELAPYYRHGPFLFVHAGIKPGTPLACQSREDLLWIRGDFLDCEDSHGFRVIHGHTPQRSGVVEQVFHNRINVDTGACFTGRLSAVRLNSDDDSVGVIVAERAANRW